MDFSIVTPTFNQPEWVQLCVNSVSDQGAVRVEHIIQDGGNGANMAWASRHPSLRLFLEKDNGMYDGVCKGIAKATGEIVAHLNSDEQYLPGTLKRVKSFFELHPEIEVLFGDAILVDEQGELLSYRRIIKPVRAHVIASHLCTLTCSAFFRRSLVERGLTYTNEWQTIGDSALTLRWIDAGVKMATLHEPLAVFTFTGTNLGAGEKARKEGEEFLVQHPLGPLASRRVLELKHRIRKLKAGAYIRRNVSIEIYTLSSPERRETKQARKLAFDWPRFLN